MNIARLVVLVVAWVVTTLIAKMLLIGAGLYAVGTNDDTVWFWGFMVGMATTSVVDALFER